MYQSSYRARRISTQVSVSKWFSFSKTQGREKETQTEQELWEQKVKKEAQSDASKGTHSVSFGGIEAEMRRISEQVTRDAQERRKRATTDT